MRTIRKAVCAIVVMALLLPLLMVFTLVPGCATVDSSASTFIVRTEQVQATASATFDFVLHVDNADRGFWRTNAPAFHAFCETLRTPVPWQGAIAARCVAVQLNVQQLKLTYKQNRDAGSSNVLFVAAEELSTLITQANSWSNIVTLPTH